MSEQKDPMWHTDTRHWRKRHHLMAWAIYLPFAAFVMWMASLLLTWLRS